MLGPDPARVGEENDERLAGAVTEVRSRVAVVTGVRGSAVVCALRPTLSREVDVVRSDEGVRGSLLRAVRTPGEVSPRLGLVARLAETRGERWLTRSAEATRAGVVVMASGVTCGVEKRSGRVLTVRDASVRVIGWNCSPDDWARFAEGFGMLAMD